MRIEFAQHLGHASVKTTMDIYGTPPLDDIQASYEEKIEGLLWVRYEQSIRPHSSLGNLAPVRYVEQLFRSAAVGELHIQPVLQE